MSPKVVSFKKIMVEKIKIEKVETMENVLLLDARTPKEYEEDHILGAINIPILTDKERHEIGLIFKQISREKAIEKGMKYFPKKIPGIMQVVKDHKDKNIVVYCARGGMRSQVIASLLDSIGFTVFKIEGGYKAFRNFLLKKMDAYQVKPTFVVLYGLTCTGKTKLLQKFPNSIDLEGLAQHRSSLYGAVGLKPHSQKKFENLLMAKLEELKNEKHIIVEGESRRIGDVIIPEFFWKAMKRGKAVLVKRSLSLRVKEMIREYFTSEKNVQQIKKITPGLNRVISKNNRDRVVELLESGNSEEVGNLLLTKYYDPLYSHTLKQQDFVLKIDNDNQDVAIEQLHLLTSNSS
jgi:tRNA 2-selenouridine synthase